jgi:hypothetical protein
MSRSGKDVVRRWVDEMVDRGRFEVADEVCSTELARRAKGWHRRLA